LKPTPLYLQIMANNDVSAVDSNLKVYHP